MAGIIYDARKIDQALIPLHCRRLEIPPFRRESVVTPHYVWETAWGHRFMVPESCTDWILQDIVEKEIHGTRPADWREQ